MVPITITLDLQQEGADTQYLDQQASVVIAQLSGARIQASKLSTLPPEGAKSAVDSIAATILLTCATSPALTELINFLKGWVERRKGRGIKLRINGSTIELSGQVNEEKITLITRWLEAAVRREDDE
jgi:hypothetical protein